MNRIFSVLMFVSLLGTMSCREEPAGSMTVSKSTVVVGEEVTFTINDAEDYTCIRWGVISSSPDFTDVSSVTSSDLTWTLKFDEPGTATVSATLKNCKKSDDPDNLCSCEKNHTSKRFEIIVEVE